MTSNGDEAARGRPKPVISRYGPTAKAQKQINAALLGGAFAAGCAILAGGND
jgi:hypothetical protein